MKCIVCYALAALRSSWSLVSHTGVVFGPLYRFYSQHVLPRLGGWVSGHPEAYTYLPRTAAVFPAGGTLRARDGNTGFYRRATPMPSVAGSFISIAPCAPPQWHRGNKEKCKSATTLALTPQEK